MSLLQDLIEWCNRNVVNYGERSCIVKHLSKLQDSKTYEEVINHLYIEGHKFSDMQLCVKLVSFTYDKPPEQIRKDLWELQRRGSSVVER